MDENLSKFIIKILKGRNVPANRAQALKMIINSNKTLSALYSSIKSGISPQNAHPKIKAVINKKEIPENVAQIGRAHV